MIKTILLVGKDKDKADELGRVLKEYGNKKGDNEIAIATASTATEALQLTADIKFDLIVADYHLSPYSENGKLLENGIKLAEALRNMEPKKFEGPIIISHRVSEGYMSACYKGTQSQFDQLHLNFVPELAGAEALYEKIETAFRTPVGQKEKVLS